MLENLTLRAGFYYHSKAEVKAAVARASEYTEINDMLKRQYGKIVQWAKEAGRYRQISPERS
ncbi:hypothetical protein [Lactobacillus delbrueckii]|uniref:hypothetical protein n=1 Tax=Lactobacillus delbrueckii TaxID=1584 RepID=UPI0005CFB823|nr:hypothetical protein [Lactobacillus delbrueckii]KNZ38118.1 hypothetical protein LDD39_04345 [Lactobacillus delbrueckii subsp. delbrueckii]